MKYVLIFLMMCLTCLGADKYVSITGNNGNAGDGPGDAAAYRDIDTGMNNVGDGDTVFLVAGTYDDATDIGAGGQIDIDGWGAGAKSFTVKPYNSGSVTIVPSIAAQGIKVAVVWPDNIITFQDLTITASASTTTLIVFVANKHTQLVFDNCVISDGGNTTRICELNSNTDLAGVCKFQNGCSITSGHNIPFGITSIGRFEMDSCIFTGTSTNNSNAVVYAITGSFDTLILNNNNFTARQHIFNASSSLSAVGDIKITNNIVALDPTAAQTSLIKVISKAI